MIQLRVLVPGIILVAFCCDAGLRLVVPPERLAFRSWEAAQIFPNPSGPFGSHFSYYNERSYGDLANMGNMPYLRHYHRESFTSDEWGYRNPPGFKQQPLGILLLGDSFASGASLSDEETLSAQLAAEGHTGVYNAGNVIGPDLWPALNPLIERLKLKHGLVVYEESERYDTPPADEPKTYAGVRAIRQFVGRDSAAYLALRILKTKVNGYLSYSPLQILIRRRFSLLFDDSWLPNAAAKNVVVRKVKGDGQFVFLKSEVENFDLSRSAKADYFVKLDAQVRATGNQLLVVLVPDKYSVYYPLLEGSDDVRARSGEQYSQLVSRTLQAAHVPVLDLTAILRTQAAQLLTEGKTNYRPDDTHWNGLGVNRAAKAILATQAMFTH